MGRRRAAFREGVDEPDRCYAQVLRDIKDARGETQEELGRLLGWSAPQVFRFEAASERPDAATHRRYCALAPTDALRAALTACGPPRESDVSRGTNGVRRSNEEWQSRALEGRGLYRLLKETYPSYPTLEVSARIGRCRCGRSWRREASGTT